MDLSPEGSAVDPSQLREQEIWSPNLPPYNGPRRFRCDRWLSMNPRNV